MESWLSKTSHLRLVIYQSDLQVNYKAKYNKSRKSKVL